MIIPSPGKTVWFRPAPPHDDVELPLAAIIARVWTPRLVALLVIGRDGRSYGQTNVQLLQDDDAPPLNKAYCEWMPSRRQFPAQAKPTPQDNHKTRRKALRSAVRKGRAMGMEEAAALLRERAGQGRRALLWAADMILAAIPFKEEREE